MLHYHETEKTTTPQPLQAPIIIMLKALVKNYFQIIKLISQRKTCNNIKKSHQKL